MNNYTGVDELLNSASMEHLIVETKHDDDTVIINGASWLIWDGKICSQLHVNGNAWIGLGAAIEHLAINRTDSSVYNLWREEGTLFNAYKFIHLKVSGYSPYGSVILTSQYIYDAVFFEDGLVLVNTVKFSTTSTGQSTIRHNNVSTVFLTNATHTQIALRRTPANTFTIQYSFDNLFDVTVDKYLFQDGTKYYTVQENVLFELPFSTLTAETFLLYGLNELAESTLALVETLKVPKVLCWFENENYRTVDIHASITATPYVPQTVTTHDMLITDPVNKYIKTVSAACTEDVLFEVSVDSGNTFYSYISNNWIASTHADYILMTKAVFNAVPPTAWNTLVTEKKYRIRFYLATVNSTLTSINILYTDKEV